MLSEQQKLPDTGSVIIYIFVSSIDFGAVRDLLGFKLK